MTLFGDKPGSVTLPTLTRDIHPRIEYGLNSAYGSVKFALFDDNSSYFSLFDIHATLAGVEVRPATSLTFYDVLKHDDKIKHPNVL